jgi:transcriptional regulator with GAF, ATPase, and Fis domain
MVRRARTDQTTAEAKEHDVASGLALLVSAGAVPSFHRIPRHGVMVIGRGAQCDVTIDDASVSRRHALIHAGTTPAIEDVGSRNGTRVGGTALARGEKQTLTIGSVIEIGSVVALVQRADSGLRAKLEGAPPSSAHAAPRPIVRDRAMHELYRLLDVIAPTDLAVLVLGETGAGKDVFTEELHARSPRAKEPLVRLNCAALPESILEGELFGYERGAFTGALHAKPGLFEAADGGTAFLDEVGEMPIATQAKLLRVLESGEVLRLGSVRPTRVDVRFVSATNRELTEEIAAGRFRADLYFRLNGIAVTVPPLRARPADVAALADHFVTEACSRLGKPRYTLDATAHATLGGHAWPGNVRELRNVANRVVVLHEAASHSLGAAEVARAIGALASASPERATVPAAPLLPREAVDVASIGDERARIEAALDRCGGNQSRAAKLLGIGRRTLVRRLDEFGITRPRKREESAD